MSRALSLNARLAQEADSSSEIEVLLLTIKNPDLEAPIRLSTDNAERISSDPLVYGALWDNFVTAAPRSRRLSEQQ